MEDLTYIKSKLFDLSKEESLLHPESKKLLKAAKGLVEAVEYIEAVDGREERRIREEIKSEENDFFWEDIMKRKQGCLP